MADFSLVPADYDEAGMKMTWFYVHSSKAFEISFFHT